MQKTKEVKITNGILTKEVLEKITRVEPISSYIDKSPNKYENRDSNSDDLYTIHLTIGKDVKLPDDCSKLFRNSDLRLILNTIEFEKGIDTSNVVNMSGMFMHNYYLKNIIGLENLNTKNVTDMSEMFECCSDIKNLNLSNFNYDNIKDISNMFYCCKSLENIVGFDTLKEKIDELEWYKSKNAFYISNKYTKYNSLKSDDLIKEFNIEMENGKLKINKGELNRISLETILKTIQVPFNKIIIGKNVKLPDDCTLLFSNHKVETIEFEKGIDTSNVKNMNEMFSYYMNTLKIIGLENLNTKNVTNMSNMFAEDWGLESLDLSSFDTSNVTNMGGMFNECNKLQSLDVSSFDTSNVTNMASMFDGCCELKSLDLSNFDTSNVRTMHGMFGRVKVENLDLSSFDTSNVENMGYMFYACRELESLDLSSFDTSNVTNMRAMFDECHELKSINLSNFDTSNVKNMEYMFTECHNLQSLDLSSFDTNNVKNMEYMFADCRNLKTLDISNFNYKNCEKISGFLGNNANLISVAGLNKLRDKATEFDKSENIFKGCRDLKEGYSVILNIDDINIHIN